MTDNDLERRLCADEWRAIAKRAEELQSGLSGDGEWKREYLEAIAAGASRNAESRARLTEPTASEREFQEQLHEVLGELEKPGLTTVDDGSDFARSLAEAMAALQDDRGA